ncbi:putative guanyl-specific ribonuclease [Salinispira pacifica]|uniref:Putative guanyl-specific ribonuclease n=2 Tax=Salinispira pacifica TaxID=1307761 RepID=V5WH33_9SPIO|nr:putative guanyl-specific ribonuclease [Salinispira pacifica]
MLSNPMGADGKPRQNFSIIESLNHYSYVSNNPVRYVDPTGEFAIAIGIGIGLTEILKAALVATAVVGTAAMVNEYGDEIAGAGQDLIQSMMSDSSSKASSSSSSDQDRGTGSNPDPDDDDDIPQNARRTLESIDETGRAPDGHKGGQQFGNREGKLPSTDGNGNNIQYREWDVNQRQPRINRGQERLVTGSDGSAYYTGDHYNSFIQIR